VKPLIVPITSQGQNQYIYDASSNLFIFCSPILQHVILRINHLNYDSIVKDLMSLFHVSQGEAINYLSFAEKLVKTYHCFFPPDEVPQIAFDEEFFSREIYNSRQLVLEVTQKCNFRCKYCVFSGNYLYSRNHTNLSMTYEIARKSIDFFISLVHSKNYLNNPSSVSIGFYGGEPFLEFPLIEKCIDYIYDHFDKDVYILITTDGSILSHKMIDFLVKRNVRLNISLDGPACEHNKNRVFHNGEGTFDAVWRNVRTIKEEYPDYFVDNVAFMITLAPNHNIFNIKRFFEENNLLKQVALNSVCPDDVAVKYKVYPNNKKNLRLLFQKYKQNLINRTPDLFADACFKGQFSDFRNMFYRPLVKFNKYTSSCYPGCEKVFVSSDGLFHTCEKINQHFPIGSYKNGIDLKKVSSVWNQYYSSVGKNCSRCISAQFCHVCLATAAKNGYFDATKQCNYFRRKLPKLLKEYIDIVEQFPEAFQETS